MLKLTYFKTQVFVQENIITYNKIIKYCRYLYEKCINVHFLYLLILFIQLQKLLIYLKMK